MVRVQIRCRPSTYLGLISYYYFVGSVGREPELLYGSFINLHFLQAVYCVCINSINNFEICWPSWSSIYYSIFFFELFPFSTFNAIPFKTLSGIRLNNWIPITISFLDSILHHNWEKTDSSGVSQRMLVLVVVKVTLTCH